MARHCPVMDEMNESTEGSPVGFVSRLTSLMGRFSIVRVGLNSHCHRLGLLAILGDAE